MASSTVTTITTTTYGLSLTEEEARVLFVILMNVGGDPAGPRGVADDIMSALQVSLDMQGAYATDIEWYAAISRKIVKEMQFESIKRLS